jgi:hypothetical protein
MDAMAGAFSKMDYQNGALSQDAYTIPKYHQNVGVYEDDGNITMDDAWVNLLAATNSDFGWHGAVQGNGVKAFGQMLADSDAFKTCMVKRAFTTLCKRAPVASDDPALHVIAQNFGHGFKLKQVFSDVALLPACIGDLQ